MPSPRSCAADIDTVLQTIRRFEEQIVNDDGSIAKKNSDVWTNISESLNYNISSNYAYTTVKMNRYNDHDILNLPSKVTEPHLDQEGEYFSAESDRDEDVLSENSTREDMNDQQIVVTLSPEKWLRMKPEERMYKCVDKDKPNRRNRAYHIIPPNSDWTDTINEHFWDHTSLSCALPFKRAKVYKFGTPFLTIFGRCKSCSSFISGSLHQEPNENRHVLINFKYRGPFVDRSTGSKLILKGTRRRSALEEFVEKNVSACTVRREEARKSMHLGDNEPSHIPTLNVLRLAKSRELKSRRVDDDPILAVGKLKYSAEYYSSIRELGLDPFHVYHWTPIQLCVYQEYCKDHPFPTVASDAIGGIPAKLKRPFGNVSGVVYLYSVAVHDHEARLNTSLQSAIDTILDEDNCPKENSFPEGMENEDETPTDFMKWAHQIISEVKGNLAEEEEGDHDNLHFLPEIVVCIAKLMKFLPLWSAITVPKFGYGSLTSSSAPVEIIFNDIKHRTFQNVHLPTTVDRFLETHLRSLDGEIKLVAATSPRKKVLMQRESNRSEEGYDEKRLCVKCADKVRTAGNSSSANDIQEDSAKENWRGLASLPSKKRQRYSYLEPSSEFEEAGFSTPLSAVTVGLLKNGNRTIVSTSSNQHLLIEAVNSSIVSNPSDTAYPFEVSLKNVPRKITLKKSGDTYFLRGIVATSSSDAGRYKKSLGINVVGHYVACCLRPDLKWEIYKDLCNSSSMTKQNVTVNCESLLYTT
ncbi:hypothetical protein PR048_017622 [Dryococelus australis]|uniref:Uncharacterized protein n=1 Tax=Dryococelus australis TaxID=614101 RepID=A0ABQ9HA44_9NEOP|nr:hypothetical protein PR048_017622 [Dryococelus australis]